MKVLKITTETKSDVKQFFIKQWGSAEMVVSSGIYNCSELDGFAYFKCSTKSESNKTVHPTT